MSITAIIYILVYFTGLISAILGRPIVGLFIYFFSFYAYAPGRWWGSALPDLRWSLIAAVITFISVIMWNKDHVKWLSIREMKYFFLYVIWVWFQNLWALHPSLHLEYSILVTKFLILMYIFAAVVKTKNDVVLVILVNLIGCAYFGWIGFTEHTGGRFERIGTPGIDDGNLLTIHMAPILVSASYLLLYYISVRKYLLLPLLALVLNGIFLTQSRGGLLALGLTGIISLFFVPKGSKKTYYVFLVLALVAATTLVGSDFKERIFTVTHANDTQEVDKSAESRIVIFEAQLEMLADKLLLGHGHRGTLLLSPSYISEEYLTQLEGSNSQRRGSHNLFMSILVDQGIIGGGILIIMIISIFNRFLSMRSKITNNHFDDRFILVFIGLNLGVITLWLASMFANSLKLEISIWMYSLIGISYTLLIKESFQTKKIFDK